MISFLAVNTVDRILITWASIETVGMTWAFVDTQSILSHTHADAVVLIFTFRVARNQNSKAVIFTFDGLILMIAIRIY